MVKKKAIKTRNGLGRGLDSLIPVINEEEESKSLEKLLDNKTADTENIEIESSETNNALLSIIEKNSGEKTTEDEIGDEISAELKVEESKELEKEHKETQKVKDEVVSEDSKVDKSNDKEITLIEESTDEINTITELTLSESELKVKEEVIEIIAENPRITLWSPRSAAVLRYLRKTKPEFSISKESSTLIDEVIKEKYPEIWGLFEDL